MVVDNSEKIADILGGCGLDLKGFVGREHFVCER
jgi:hypothetical protein